MKFSTLAAVITALVASSSALPAPVESREGLVENISKLVASNTGNDHKDHFDEAHVPRSDLAESVEGSANKNFNNNLNDLIVGPRDAVTVSLAGKGGHDLVHDFDHPRVAVPRSLIGGLLDGNVNNALNGNHPKALVRPVVQPKVVPRHELTDLANGNINENKPAVLVRPIVGPHVLLAPTLGERDLLHDILNGDVNSNRPKLLVRPVIQPKIHGVPRALKEALSNDLDGNGNGNKPEAIVRPAVTPQLTVEPVVTPRSEELSDDFSNNSADFVIPGLSHAPKEVLNGDANGNLNGNEPMVFVRPAVAPKLTLAPEVHSRGLHGLIGDLNKNANGNQPKFIFRPAVAPKLTVAPVVTPRSDELSNNNAKITIDNEELAFHELPFAEHETRALKEILNGDLNGNGNGNQPKLLLRPAVVPKVVVKPVVTPRDEELNNIEEQVAGPEFLFAHGRPAFPVDHKDGTLSGDANGNLNGNEPQLLVRPAVAPKLTVAPVVGPRAQELDNIINDLITPLGHGALGPALGSVPGGRLGGSSSRVSSE